MKLVQSLLKNFPFEPTADQTRFFNDIPVFLDSKKTKPAFVLRGYAGTGKSSVLSALVKVLNRINYKFVLLAPTGRAAKVISSYSGFSAGTIHREIFRAVQDEKTGMVLFKLNKNTRTDTLFIIDESSMIPVNKGLEPGYLDKLIEYVYSVDKNNRILFAGDAGQLPPINQVKSYALDPDYLVYHYNLTIYFSELNEVMRQSLDSGILDNAVRVRNMFAPADGQRKDKLKFHLKGGKDIYRMGSIKLEDGLRYAYDKFGMENTIVICRSNKTANRVNQFIRNKILFYEEELTVGDYLMAVKNNYFWQSDSDKESFIANGDIFTIKRILNIEDRYGFRFADVTLQYNDLADVAPLDIKINLTSIYSETASLSNEKSKELYLEILKDNPDLKKKKDKIDRIQSNSYYQAVQVKLSYSITCHKAQGGQWKAVFLEQGYLPDERLNEEFYRWLYTGVTRATEELYLVDFDEKFF